MFKKLYNKFYFKKILVAVFSIILLLGLYLIPDNRKEIDLKNTNVEYTYDNIVNTIYLVDNNDYVARTSIESCNCTDVDLAKDLVEGLIIDGKKSNNIPNGFRSIIPSNTSILDISLENKILTIDFSKEFLDINEKDEEKMIEALIYTLTSINGIDKVIIKVEGEVLRNLPSNTSLPSILDKSYGVNKTYDLTTINNIYSYTMYYVNDYNDNKYYVPVTKYVNTNIEDPVKLVIKELSSSPIYETNLMSYLNANTEIESYELNNNNLKLNFNELLLNDINENNVLEEVIYTISLSMDSLYENLETVSFYVNDNEVYTLNIDDLK